MTDERFRQEITRALDARLRELEPTPRQKEIMMKRITGGQKVKRNMRVSLGLVLAVVLTMLAVGAAAAALLSAREVIEQTALPMARENDTDTRKIETYTHDQLVALVAAANENGISLDETTGIMRALRRGEGYWEDEAIMEICREAFGGLIDEWTWDEQYWYMNLMAQTQGYEENTMDYPGEGDMKATDAYPIADAALMNAYEGAKDLQDSACYKRHEFFYILEGENREKAGSVWCFTYKPLDLTHATYTISINEKGEVIEMEETPQDWSRYTVGDLEWGINESYRAPSRTKRTWSQEAWHVYRDMLPGAQKDGAWHLEHDAYLACAYPLPDAEDMTWQAARDIILRDAGISETEADEYQKVLLADAAGRHIWKITFYRQDQLGMAADQRSFEIDAKTGEILQRITWGKGDMAWRAWVPDAVYRRLTAGMLTGEKAVDMAQRALREKLGDDSIPYTDPEAFEQRVNFSEWNQAWSVTFKTKSLQYATGAVSISEPDHTAKVTNSAPSQVDGDSLWDRFRQVYGTSRWRQETWVLFAQEMQKYEPTEWIGRLLKSTEYPEESSVRMTREQAVDIAFAHNDWQEEEELDATLIGAEPHPVWKVVLSGRECIWLYEIDAEDGEVLDKEKYAPDNSDFDHPVKRYTLHRDFAPAYVAAFGPEQLAVIEIAKAFGDLSFDTPIATVLGEDMNSESLSEEIAAYTARVEDHTVTIVPDQPGIPAYRVTFTDGWLTEKAEIIAN